MSRGRVLVLASVMALWPVPAVSGQPPQGRREDLMDQLGIPKKKPPPPAEETPEQPDPPDRDDRPRDEDGSEDDSGDASAGQAGTARKIVFSGRVRAQLNADCKSCHTTGGSAGNTRYVISGGFNDDYRSAKRLVDTKRPSSSVLLTKAAGHEHAGGRIWAKSSTKHERLREWIEGGALKGGGGTTSPPSTPTSPPPGAPAGDARPPKSEGEGKRPPESGTSTLETSPEPETTPAEAPSIAFTPTIHQLLRDRCSSCHASSRFATGSLMLDGDVNRDYASVRALVSTEAPSTSRLLSKALGQEHGGGRSLTVDSEDYRQLLAWIEAGAPGPGAPGPDATDPATGPADPAVDDPPVEVDATTGASQRADPSEQRLGDGTPVPEAAGSRLPFSLPYHLRLNGLIDLSYERRDYNNHPFGPGRNALRSYHHFLFLSRSGAEDPFGFNIEMLTQQFFEFNARFVTPNERAKFLIKAGKIMVPFGDEPLFHSSYGGRTGFDQQLLPFVWAQPGLALDVHINAGPVSISNDTYAIQGYGLRAPDGVLELQNDFSTLDDFQFAVGNRVGLSWAPLTAWYSLQVNPLGFDRVLFMQAFDFEFWRLRDVPFLEDIVVGFGAMRADVSGGVDNGGPGKDYYHFGSYGKVRYYPIDWLYLQYRWGLRTFDNRRHLFYDDSRADERDGSSHNLTIGGTYKGFFAALQLFWNLEKANEQNDDFLRVTVGYAF